MTALAIPPAAKPPALAPATVWVMRALARYLKKGSHFSLLDVRGWIRDEQVSVQGISAALDALEDYGALEDAGAIFVDGRLCALWRLSARGQEMCWRMRAAARGRMARPPRPARARRRPSARTLSMQLWGLLAARRSITVSEAAEVLLDAAEDAATLASRRKTLAGYLWRWARRAPRLIKVNAAGAERRYVLLKDAALPPARA